MFKRVLVVTGTLLVALGGVKVAYARLRRRGTAPTPPADSMADVRVDDIF